MRVSTLVLGVFDTNCYLVTDEITGESAVIDPADYSTELIRLLERSGMDKVKYVLLTHGHFDHIGGVDSAVRNTGAKLVIGREDAGMLDSASRNAAANFGLDMMLESRADILVSGGERLRLGETEIEVIATPGHTKGGVTYRVENALFCGDTLFRGSYGRYDLPGGDIRELCSSVSKLLSLEGSLEVYSGHGMKTTTNYERKYNPLARERK